MFAISLSIRKLIIEIIKSGGKLRICHQTNLVIPKWIYSLYLKYKIGLVQIIQIV